MGSARAETDSSGTATGTQDFDAFGNTIASSGSTGSPYNFAGDWAYQSNGDAGLQHVGARYYDPQVGRFASRDSMLDQIPYAYCAGEPTDGLDPTGDGPFWLQVLLVALAVYHNVRPGVNPGWRPFRREQPQIVVVEPEPAGGDGPGSTADPLPDGEIDPEDGGAAGTVASGVLIGGTLIGQTVGWRNGIEAYMDPDGKWPVHPGGW